MDRIENIVSNNTPIVVSLFTDPLLINGLHNPVVLLLGACILRALPSNDLCLYSDSLATALFATQLSYLLDMDDELFISSHLCDIPMLDNWLL
jgi:predicted permease